MDNFNIRNARPQDCPVIAELIRGLAHYEKLDDQCQVTPELIEKPFRRQTRMLCRSWLADGKKRNRKTGKLCALFL